MLFIEGTTLPLLLYPEGESQVCWNKVVNHQVHLRDGVVQLNVIWNPILNGWIRILPQHRSFHWRKSTGAPWGPAHPFKWFISGSWSINDSETKLSQQSNLFAFGDFFLFWLRDFSQFSMLSKWKMFWMVRYWQLRDVFNHVVEDSQLILDSTFDRICNTLLNTIVSHDIEVVKALLMLPWTPRMTPQTRGSSWRCTLQISWVATSVHRALIW